ncbi:MAG: hypothetical protein ABGZ53_07255, partial [Fuerstiella sp.]
AADIVAFLLSQGEAQKFEVVEPSDTALDALVKLFLKKSRFSEVAVQQILASRTFPQKSSDVAGDERVLATEDKTAVDEEEWKERKLEYIGRRTISRYGCYGCHDIPGYADARPIGVALQDWGRKDTSKLGLEHIEEFLHHHGEPDGSSTRERVAQALRDAEAEAEDADKEQLNAELTQAFFYESLLHHGRPGFLWQKLRGPRTYDYLKTDTKGYDERLRMPKFPLKEDEVEAIATFVLGLVAEPPSEKYIYTPDVRNSTRVEGEFLLAKYNCTGCHMVDLPRVTFGADLDEDIFPPADQGLDHEAGIQLLLKRQKPRMALTGEQQMFTVLDEQVELPLASFHGMEVFSADPEDFPEDRAATFATWEVIDFSDDQENPLRYLPGSQITVPVQKLVDVQPARGGVFAEWLVEHLMQERLGKTRDLAGRSLAWQDSPPPLYQEGFKVQTSWLHDFLLNPMQIRNTTVLRMPKFNMSSEEAAVLANYFAAVDGAPFPYDNDNASAANYLATRDTELRASGVLKPDQSYLDQAWQTLNGLSDGLHSPTNGNTAKCAGCHSVGGLEYVKDLTSATPTPQGPDLRRVQRRLRPDWVQLWLYNPKWTTPYTSMPNNFPANTTGQAPQLFGGEPGQQVIGVRDALMNYSRLIEQHGIPERGKPAAATPPATVDAGAE